MGIKMVRTKIKMRSRLLAKGIAVIIFGAFAMGLICDNSTYAAGGGWVGKSDVPVSTNPPDTESTGGSGDGFSWIYYQSTGVATGDITFGSTFDFIYNSVSYPATISGTCSTKNNGINGGFWHYGLNDQARLGKEWNGETFYYFGQFTNSGHAGYTPMRYTTGENGWGHMITIPYGYYERTEKTKGNLNHAIYDSAGLIKLYEAKMSNLTKDTNILMPDGKTYSMLEMFNISYSYMDEEGEEGTDTEIPRGTYAFCFYGRIENDFLGESIASASSSDGSSGSTTTGIVGMGSQTDAENVVVTAKKDDTVTIEFRHNTYSTLYNRRAYWLVDRPNTSGFNVISSELARANRGTDRFGTPKENNYYTPKTGNSILIDKYTIKFTEKGSYTFCEDLKIERSYNAVESVDYTSKACVTVNVDGGGPGGGGDPDSLEYMPGITQVISRIKNVGLTDRKSDATYAGWQGIVAAGNKTEDENKKAVGEQDGVTYRNVTYAKPGDKIEWVNEYSPGAQSNAGSTVTSNYDSFSSSNCSCTAKNETFSNIKSFKNKYQVDTNSPFGLNDYSGKISDPFSSTFLSEDLRVGVTARQVVKNNYIVERDKVGKDFVFNDLIQTVSGVPTSTSVSSSEHTDCCYICTCDKPECCGGGCGGHTIYPWSYKDKDILKSQSFVKIPYNFINEASFTLKGKEEEGIGQVV